MENELNDEDNKLLQINEPEENRDDDENRESTTKKKQKMPGIIMRNQIFYLDFFSFGSAKLYQGPTKES